MHCNLLVEAFTIVRQSSIFFIAISQEFHDKISQYSLPIAVNLYFSLFSGEDVDNPPHLESFPYLIFYF